MSGWEGRGLVKALFVFFPIFLSGQMLVHMDYYLSEAGCLIEAFQHTRFITNSAQFAT